jgi:uncharacterized protein (DUF885 family)
MRLLSLFRRCVCGICCLLLPPVIHSQTDKPATSAQNEEAQKFQAFLADDWKKWMQEYPEFATFVGYPGQNRRWVDDSPAGREARIKHLHESLEAMKQFHRERLLANEQLNYDLYRKRLQLAEEGLQFGGDALGGGNVWLPINQMGGVQQDPSSLLALMPHQTVSDYEDILARMAALPVLVEQSLEWMKVGLKKGYSPPKITMRDVPKQVEDLIPSDPMKSALLQPFQNFPPGIGEADRVRLIEQARQTYSSKDVPAYQKLREYLVSMYIPACRESIAARDLPNGVASYEYQVRWHTTTQLTPAQIHEIGLSEVKRIRSEMEKLISSTGFQGTFKEFAEFLRTDPQFYYEKPDDLIDGYRIIVKKIDPELAHEFGNLPRLP